MDSSRPHSPLPPIPSIKAKQKFLICRPSLRGKEAPGARFAEARGYTYDHGGSIRPPSAYPSRDTPVRVKYSRAGYRIPIFRPAPSRNGRDERFATGVSGIRLCWKSWRKQGKTSRNGKRTLTRQYGGSNRNLTTSKLSRYAIACNYLHLAIRHHYRTRAFWAYACVSPQPEAWFPNPHIAAQDI